jgi:Fic family protein
MLKPSYAIPSMPPAGVNLEAPAILKALALAHRHLVELKGCAKSIPNQAILINTLTLQEAKASSEIESYATTQDELFQADLQLAEWVSPVAKEVARYREALALGFDQMKRQQGLLTNSHFIAQFQLLKNSAEGFRQSPGTVLKNERTGETVFVPPQEAAQIVQHMAVLERFINEPDEVDALVKMALVHHQFESIHPFTDGNGRIGRMLCVLYLARACLLDAPVLYLSRYINQHKLTYYRLLPAVRADATAASWTEWVVFMLQAVAQTAQSTVELVDGMRELMANIKQRLRTELPKLYSQDLLNNLFRHPYTRIEFVQRDLGVTRQTASKYLKQLAGKGFVREHSRGKVAYFINRPLVRLITAGDR